MEGVTLENECPNIEDVVEPSDLNDKERTILKSLMEVLFLVCPWYVLILKYFDPAKIHIKIQKIDGILKYAKISNISERRDLIRATAVVVG